MRRFLRTLLRVVLGLVALAVAWVGLVVWAYRLPPLAVPAQADLTLADVTIVNPGNGRTAHRTIALSGGRIVTVTGDPVPGADRRLAGMFVLPGLNDMHVHHPPAAAPRDVRLFGMLFLAHGVTTVRDTGCFDDSIWDLRRRIDRGDAPGLRVVACGPIFDGDPPVWAGSRVVRMPAEAKAAVDEVVAAGADCIKVYEKIDAATLAAIRSAAAAHGRPVVGHVPRAVPFEEARIADVQHLTGTPRRTSAAFVLPADAWRDVDEARIEQVVRVSREQGIAHTPTLVVMHRLAEVGAVPPPFEHPSALLLPRYYRDVIWRNPPDPFRGLREHLPMMDRLVLRLHEAGVRIHAGSDTLNPFVVPGTSLHEELRLLVGAGLSVEAAWVAATRDAGASLGRPGSGP